MEVFADAFPLHDGPTLKHASGEHLLVKMFLETIQILID